MPQRPSFSFVFVCQAGMLEDKALLLAASLRKNLTCRFELIAAVPTPVSLWGRPSPTTLELLADMGVRIVEIRNEIDPAYAIGNKVSCLKIEVNSDRLVFLDSDMLLARPCWGPDSRNMPFAAKPSDLPNVIHPRQWKRAYAAAGVTVPAGRVATTMYGQIMLPYFNAGLIAVDPLAGLGDAWLQCCRKIDARWGIRLKRPHLDQIALPVALRKLDLPYGCLAEPFNFPAHLKPIDPLHPPFFVHYHGAEVLRREPMLTDLVRELGDEYPNLGKRLAESADYGPMFKSSRSPAALGLPARRAHGSASASRLVRATPELIVTGIPRSGTSYLCNLLHRFTNCVVLNEPEGIARSLRKEPIPFGVGTFYRDIRRDIVEGRPVRNKLRDGKVTDETMEANELTEYVPRVKDDEFVLGMKNPLGFLSRLGGLRRAMPQARVVVCVRNPLDTIASWKTTFSHLRTADVAALWNGGLQDPTLPACSRAALQDIAQIKSLAWRRAAWWRYLAALVLDAGPDVQIVPYSLAVKDPLSVVQRILSGWNAGVPAEPIVPSQVRTTRRCALDEEDLQAIRALCGEAAAALGVAEEDPVAQTEVRRAPTAGVALPAESPAISSSV